MWRSLERHQTNRSAQTTSIGLIQIVSRAEWNQRPLGQQAIAVTTETSPIQATNTKTSADFMIEYQLTAIR